MSIEIKIPTVGESISQVTLSNWVKKNGDYVEMDELIAELESDKATFELTAEQAGILETIANEGDVLNIGDIIGSIKEEASGAHRQGGNGPITTTPNEQHPAHPITLKKEAETYAMGTPSPSAAKILAEKERNPNTVQGTGVGGRITKEDALRAEKGASSSEKKQPSQENEKLPVPALGQTSNREEHKEKLSPLRKTIAKRLVAVRNETAMLTTFNEVNMQPIMHLRAKYQDQFKGKHGLRLGFMSFFTKAVCQAFEDFPAVNARIDGEHLVYYRYADISIAVSTPKGLVVPVIKNAESKSLAEIEREVLALAEKARENKLSLEEMVGGTFTITNGGLFGSLLSTPIINPPQSAILGMHKIMERPIAEDGKVVIRPMMYIALSYDHRVIDGRESVGFLVRIKELLEDPVRFLLSV